MPNHIFINRESGNDNISIFYDEPSLTHAQLKDKQVLLEETQHELEKVQVKKWYQFWR